MIIALQIRACRKVVLRRDASEANSVITKKALKDSTLGYSARRFEEIERERYFLGIQAGLRYLTQI